MATAKCSSVAALKTIRKKPGSDIAMLSPGVIATPTSAPPRNGTCQQPAGKASTRAGGRVERQWKQHGPFINQRERAGSPPSAGSHGLRLGR